VQPRGGLIVKTNNAKSNASSPTLFIHLQQVYRHRPVRLSLSQTTAAFDGSTATALRLQPQVQLEAYNDMPLLKAIFGEEEDEE
jgi:hypothetical protein